MEKQTGYTFFWIDKSEEAPRLSGVSFVKILAFSSKMRLRLYYYTNA